MDTRITLMNHERCDKALILYADDPAPFETDKPDDIRDEDYSRGFYIRHDDTYLAVFASAEGPILLLSDIFIQLNPDTIRLERRNGIRRNHFRVSREAHALYETEYDTPEHEGYDNWSDPDSVDFFRWLCDHWKTPSFQRFFTFSQG